MSRIKLAPSLFLYDDYIFVVDRYTLSIPSESNSFAFEKKTARAFVLVKSPEYELIVGSFGAFA